MPEALTRIRTPSFSGPDKGYAASRRSSHYVCFVQGGILAIDTSPATDTVVATAGMDGQVHVFDRAAGRIVAELQGHSKKVNGAVQGLWWLCVLGAIALQL